MTVVPFCTTCRDGLLLKEHFHAQQNPTRRRKHAARLNTPALEVQADKVCPPPHAPGAPEAGREREAAELARDLAGPFAEKKSAALSFLFLLVDSFFDVRHLVKKRLTNGQMVNCFNLELSTK